MCRVQAEESSWISLGRHISTLNCLALKGRQSNRRADRYGPNNIKLQWKMADWWSSVWGGSSDTSSELGSLRSVDLDAIDTTTTCHYSRASEPNQKRYNYNIIFYQMLSFYANLNFAVDVVATCTPITIVQYLLQLVLILLCPSFYYFFANWLHLHNNEQSFYNNKFPKGDSGWKFTVIGL